MLYHCFTSSKQSLLDFFKLVDSLLIVMLLYDSLNLIVSGVHQSHLGCWGHRSEKVKLRGLDNVAYKMWKYAVLLKDKIIICNVFGSYYHVAEMVNTSVMLSIDMQFMLDKEKTSILDTAHKRIGSMQIQWLLSVCKTGNWMPCSLSWSCLVHTSCRFMNEK